MRIAVVPHNHPVLQRIDCVVIVALDIFAHGEHQSGDSLIVQVIDNRGRVGRGDVINCQNCVYHTLLLFRLYLQPLSVYKVYCICGRQRNGISPIFRFHAKKVFDNSELL